MSADGEGGVWAIFDNGSNKIASNDSGESRGDVEEVLVTKLLIMRSYCETVRLSK
jgi:hypothetical protein